MFSIAAMLMNLLVYALVVAVVARTVTAEEIFSEVREWARARKTRVGRKLFYPLTCNFCFSFWISAAVVFLAGFNLFEQRDILSFLFTLWTIMAVSVSLQAAYEYLTVKVKDRRVMIEYNQLAIEHQQREAEVHIFNLNQMRKAQKAALETEARMEAEAQERQTEAVRQALLGRAKGPGPGVN